MTPQTLRSGPRKQLPQVGGRKFHAHRLALLAASDTFRAMFDGEYKERTAPLIPIPNIKYEVRPP